MATIEKALRIATRAHAGASDRQGQPYILHPLRVMLDVKSMDAKIVAVLHDVIEDTEMTIEDLGEKGFSDGVLEAIALLTHDNGNSYADYVVACRANKLAREVKLADLRDHSSHQRMVIRPDKMDQDSKRFQKYIVSYQYLTNGIDEATYRQLMSNIE